MYPQRKIVFAVIVCFMLGGFLFLYHQIIIPGAIREAETKVRMELDDNVMPKAKVAVVVDDDGSNSGISKYTQINEEIIKRKIKIIDMPLKYIPPHALSTADIIKGKVTKEDLRVGEVIISDSLSNEKKWFGEYDRWKEFTVSSIVAGEVKAGNIVDMIVNYGNGDYDIVVPKIKIKSLIDNGQTNIPAQQANPNPSVPNNKTNAGNGKEPEHSNTAANPQGNANNNNKVYTIVFAVDEEQFRDLTLASYLGKFETRLYIDDNQPASKKTFDYVKGLDRLKLQNTTTKLKTVEEMKRDKETFPEIQMAN